ncbi:hypothetical protein GON03_18375 [Nocardioides sp. MAH-18]|uniref:Uncharacterized protein n=1 Tax=Nocardioides agri TaxID=2682843 RepID=A0A6L6XWH6_9ACTN|nr:MULTISPECIES: hypothetical protein [unclassified Nocardioides]MBA2956309.1 hypothetical protein [Nocardioides sp. CGMCC 1.13656]MVQ51152.1 hypothetical protein [Nocardioides sp. MAH-18]
MVAVGWTVLALVFLDEVLAVAAFGLASLALWDVGHQRLAVALLMFSVVVNALAQLPAIARLPVEAQRG